MKKKSPNQFINSVHVFCQEYQRLGELNFGLLFHYYYLSQYFVNTFSHFTKMLSNRFSRRRTEDSGAFVQVTGAQCCYSTKGPLIQQANCKSLSPAYRLQGYDHDSLCFLGTSFSLAVSKPNFLYFTQVTRVNALHKIQKTATSVSQKCPFRLENSQELLFLQLSDSCCNIKMQLKHKCY